MEAGQTIIRGPDSGRRPERDRRTVPELGHPSAERLRPGAVVDLDSTLALAVRPERHDPASQAHELREFLRGLGLRGLLCARGGEDQTARPLPAKRTHDPCLTRLVALGDRDRHDQALLVGAAGHTRRDQPEVGVGDIGDEEGDDR